MKNFTLIFAIFASFFAVNNASAQIQADFSYSIVIDSCDSWFVAFTNNTNASPQSTYNWTFSNGASSNLQNPPNQWFFGIQTQFATLEVIDFTSNDTSVITQALQLFSGQPQISIQLDPIGGGSCNSPQVYTFNAIDLTMPASGLDYYWYVDGILVGAGQSMAYTFAQSGAYQVSCEAISANGCSTFITESLFVGPSNNLIVTTTYNIINSTCSDAIVDLFSTVTGGTGPYTYAWNWYDLGASNLANPQQVGLSAFDPNVYLTVTDANGCTGSAQMPVTWNTSGQFTASISANLLSSNCNESVIEFSGTASTSIVAWDWLIYDGCNNTYQNTVQNTVFTFDNSCGFVNALLTVYDVNGCQEFADFIMPLDTNGLFGTAVVNNTGSCSGTTCTSSITVSAGGGVAPYSYSIDQVVFTSNNVFTNLCDGVYQYSIEDANGCLFEESVSVGAAGPPLTLIPFEYYENCDSTPFGNGSFIQISTTGGATPYTYLWSDGTTSPSLFNITPGTYSVIVTDANGCTVTETFIVPDNDCYTISGNVYVDLDGDCMLDANEVGLGNVWVDLADSNGNWLWIYDYADANGAFDISAPAGTYYFDINGFNLNGYVQNCPGAGFTVTIDSTNPNATVDFFMTPPPPTQDLSVSIGHITNVAPSTVPGQNRWSYIQYCNDGTIPMSGNVVWSYSSELTYAGPGYTNIVPDIIDPVNHTLTFNFSNLQPGECVYVRINFDVPNTMQIGTIINDEVTINPIPGDVTPLNNVAYSSELSVGSWDPNDKAVYPAGDITVDDNDHDYHIRFQNEGNANATRVIIRDVLDDNLVLHSLRNVNASHSFVLTVENDNELVFTFDNIQLPPKDVDEAGSQGFVSFSISQVEDLTIGESVENTAAIYFDFNEAVITNTVVNTIVEKTTAIEELVDIDIDLYPNPTTGILQVSVNENYEIASISVFDVIGNKAFNRKGNNDSTMQLDVRGNAAGIYFIQIATDQGTITKKFILEQR